MKKFLNQLLAFIMIFTFAVAAVLAATTLLVKYNFNYSVPKEKNILILGDSHTQCAIDDSKIPNAINLSESADTYFYSYAKLRNILGHNKRIDTLVLGYSFNNVAPAQDKWLKNPSINAFKLPLHFFLLDDEALVGFYKINSKQFLKDIPSIIERNVLHLAKILRNRDIRQFGIGGFTGLHKVLDTKKPGVYNEKKANPLKLYSHEDLEYLKKIEALCKEKKVALLLINTPLFPKRKPYNDYYRKEYLAFAERHLRYAKIIDFSALKVNDAFFADYSHLNAKGADFFTKILLQDKWNPVPEHTPK